MDRDEDLCRRFVRSCSITHNSCFSRHISQIDGCHCHEFNTIFRAIAIKNFVSKSHCQKIDIATVLLMISRMFYEVMYQISSWYIDEVDPWNIYQLSFDLISTGRYRTDTSVSWVHSRQISSKSLRWKIKTTFRAVKKHRCRKLLIRVSSVFIRSFWIIF